MSKCKVILYPEWWHLNELSSCRNESWSVLKDSHGKHIDTFQLVKEQQAKLKTVYSCINNDVSHISNTIWHSCYPTLKRS